MNDHSKYIENGDPNGKNRKISQKGSEDLLSNLIVFFHNMPHDQGLMIPRELEL